MQVQLGINWQGVTGFNKHAGSAQIGYTCIRADVARAGYELQVGFSAPCLPFHDHASLAVLYVIIWFIHTLVLPPPGELIIILNS